MLRKFLLSIQSECSAVPFFCPEDRNLSFWITTHREEDDGFQCCMKTMESRGRARSSKMGSTVGQKPMRCMSTLTHIKEEETHLLFFVLALEEAFVLSKHKLVSLLDLAQIIYIEAGE